MQAENKDAGKVMFGYMFGISTVGEDGNARYSMRPCLGPVRPC